MLESHTRYMPVMDGATLIGVLSFHDVAKAVLEEQTLREPHAEGLHQEHARVSPAAAQAILAENFAPWVQALGLDRGSGRRPMRRPSGCRSTRGWCGSAVPSAARR